MTVSVSELGPMPRELAIKALDRLNNVLLQGQKVQKHTIV